MTAKCELSKDGNADKGMLQWTRTAAWGSNPTERTTGIGGKLGGREVVRLPQGKAQHLTVQCQVVSPQNIDANNKMLTEQDIFRNVCVHVCKCVQ